MIGLNIGPQAVTQDISDKLDTKNLYDTPIYKTRQRGAFKKGNNIKYKNIIKKR